MTSTKATTNSAPSIVRRAFRMPDRISTALLASFLLVVVFDPSDSLTGAKRFVFAALLLWWLLHQITPKKPPIIPLSPICIAISFGLFFPLLSVLSFYLQDKNSSGYEGLSVLQGYTSLVFLILISSIRAPVLQIFINVLTAQAFATIGIYVALNQYPGLVDLVQAFGYEKGFLWINDKAYGGFQFLQIFFKTAPLLVIPTAYYSQKYFLSSGSRNRTAFILLLLTCLALFISGTRANMLFAILIPTFFFFLNRRQAKVIKGILILLVPCILFGAILISHDTLVAMLDPNEFSNAVKLGYWNDYLRLFSNPIVLLFGQGIGALHYFESLGQELLITEITLLELIRNFGLIIAAAYIAFWVAPLILLRRAMPQYTWLWIGYGAYLIISMSNYFLMSSTGMIFLSIVYNECLNKHNDTHLRA